MIGSGAFSFELRSKRSVQRANQGKRAMDHILAATKLVLACCFTMGVTYVLVGSLLNLFFLVK